MSHSFIYSTIQGVLVCIGGLGMLVGSDHLTDKNYPALNKAKGDVFMIAGATLYGFSTSLIPRTIARENCAEPAFQRMPRKNSSSGGPRSMKYILPPSSGVCGSHPFLAHLIGGGPARHVGCTGLRKSGRWARAQRYEDGFVEWCYK